MSKFTPEMIEAAKNVGDAYLQRSEQLWEDMTGEIAMEFGLTDAELDELLDHPEVR